MNNEAVFCVPAPCVPNLVQADLDCESGAVSVSWEASHGAIQYTTVAQGNGGYSVSHNSSGTTCQFDALPCGLSYAITVRALGNVCSSAESVQVHIDTGTSHPGGKSTAAPSHGTVARFLHFHSHVTFDCLCPPQHPVHPRVWQQ